jgi:hypothetical protein
MVVIGTELTGSFLALFTGMRWSDMLPSTPQIYPIKSKENATNWTCRSEKIFDNQYPSTFRNDILAQRFSLYHKLAISSTRGAVQTIPLIENQDPLLFATSKKC